MEGFGEDLTLNFERPTDKQIKCASFIAEILGLKYDAKHFTKKETTQFISRHIEESKEAYRRRLSSIRYSRNVEEREKESAYLEESEDHSRYERYLSNLAFSTAEDGEHGVGIGARYNNFKGGLSYEQYQRGERIHINKVWDVY